MVQDLRRIVSKHPSYPDPLFFYPGTVADGETFFSRFWPEARAVSDPDRKFFDALQVKAAGLRKLFGPTPASEEPTSEDATLFDFLAGHIGTVEGSTEVFSDNCSQRFAEGLAEKL